MRLFWRGLRPLGGAVGIAVAIAGGLGAAVGVYSLPDPRHFSVSADVYARADQAAFAEWQQETEDGFLSLRLMVSRTASGGGRGFVSESSRQAAAEQDVNTYFQASVETCGDAGCDERFFDSPVPIGSFRFSPVLRDASFSGEVDGCRFEIEWTGTGAVVPFHQANTFSHVSQWNAFIDQDAFASVARQAHVSIAACFLSAPDAPGSLSVGLSRTRNSAGAGFGCC